MDASGFIQAGGQSRRMGVNKALVQFAGAPLILRPLEVLRQTTKWQAIVTSEAHLYATLGVECVPDYRPSLGPLSGICSALMHSQTDLIVTVACDMPFLTKELICYLIESAKGGAEAVVPTDDKGYLQPLAAVYRKSCLQPALELLSMGELALKALIRKVDTFYLDFDSLRPFVGKLPPFANINTPQELALYENLSKTN